MLIPDAVPTNFVSADVMTVVVSGATVKPIPMPTTTIDGRKVFQ